MVYSRVDTQQPRAATAAIQHEQTQDGFTSIGLPTEAGWYVSGALYWIAGLAIVLIDQFTDNTVDPVIALLGTITLAAAPLMLLGARFAPTAAWGAPVRLLFPMIIFGTGAFVVDSAITALGLLYLFPLLAVAYMHRPQVSIPFCSISLVGMFVAFVAYDSSNVGLAWAIVFCGCSAALVAGMVISQAHVRNAAAANHSRSITDPLTGLANLRGLHEHLRQQISRSARDECEIVLFAIDLDDFKEVNDNFSYALGDAVLQGVARAIEQELEPGDLVARRGGDEFAIVALATPGRHMARFSDRVAAAIERTRRAASPSVNPRASITRATHVRGESVEEFIMRVDDGLHTAKLDAHPERIELESELERRPPEPGDEDQTERMLSGARRAQRGMDFSRSRRSRRESRLSWMLTAGVAFVSSLLLTAVALPGLLPEGRNHVTLTAVLLLLIVGCGCLAVARSDNDERWMHLPVTLIFALNLAAVAAAGDSAHALAVLCVLPVPLAAYVLDLRASLPYLLVGIAAYGYFVLGSEAGFATLQAGVMIGVTVVLTALLLRGKHAADEFSAAAEAITVVDPLTGAVNLRGMRQRIEQEIARSHSTGEELCVVMIDLERFKEVNDFYTHSTGDALLIETTRAIESVVREDELVARRGGDEFAVVCVPPVQRNMDVLTGRIARAIRDARSALTPDIPAGATVVPVFHEEGEDAQELMRRADEELRRVKASERSALVG